MLPEGVKDFAGDLSEQEQKVVWATHFAPDADLFNQKVDGTAWKTKPSWSIVATEDRTVHPDLERFLAKRMGATTVEAKSSQDRKSTRLNSSHGYISYAVFCLKKKTNIL